MFEREFGRRLMAERGFGGEKLDIGCGGKLSPALRDHAGAVGILDGVDPSPDIQKHPHLRNRWQEPFETAAVPSVTYDLAFAYNVVEHIANATPFFRAVRRILKPGGVFWALTPNGTHPFAYCVRFVQFLRLKRRLAVGEGYDLNHYPAHYRLNRRGSIARAAISAGFSRLDLVYMPCIHWDNYFPRPFRIFPHLYDRALGLRFKSCMLLLAYRLE